MARLIALGVLAGSASAPAETIFEVAPAAGAGATDNVQVTANDQQHVADAFVQVGGGARLRYNVARSTHGLGYRINWLRYVQGRGPTVTTQDLAWTSSLALTGTITLRLTANASLSRTSRFDPTDPANATPQANVVGAVPFVSFGGAEELSYQPTPRRRYSEALTATRIDYLGTNVNLPTTTLVTANLYGNYLTGRETFSLTLTVSDSIFQSDSGSTMPVNTFDRGQIFLAQALAGWGHELSPVWSTLVQAGPSLIFKWGGPAVLAPAGTAGIYYARQPWFASLTAVQTPSVDLYVGDAVISDQLVARVAVPLTRSELIYLGGIGSYLYARIPNDQRLLTRAYDQFFGGVSLVARFQRLPVFASLNYLALSQRGSSMPGRSFSDLAIQTVLLNITGTFAWGPGTPPLFGRVL